jgi:RimJ/RimL family protein N-acetyltransferase
MRVNSIEALVGLPTTNSGDGFMALATWWQGDPEMNLAAFPDFHARPADDDKLLARINHLNTAQVWERRRAGHRPYIGYIGETAVTYGWAATRLAAIGELHLEFAIPAGDRYLWDFATVPEWQGKRLYPRLLHVLVRMEDADRFWIIHTPENLPSGAGMQRAGFQSVGQLAFRADGSVGLIPVGPLIKDEFSPCRRCMEQVACTSKLDPDNCGAGR